jgi:glycosyltransferase involved in cell wall biosynthesis
MKVLHVIPGIAWRYGGPTATIRSLCSELARLPNTEIELATTDADGPGGRLAEQEVPRDYPVHIFQRTATEQWKYSRSLGTWLRKNTSRFDVVHIHALWSYSSNAAARAAHDARVPYIIRPAGMLSEYTFAHRAWKKRLYWQLMERSTVGRATAFHATSSAEKCDILRVRPDAIVHVIPNGVDQGAWSVDGQQVGQNTHRDTVCSERPIVLFMSRLHPKKGIVDLLLPAWAQVCSDAVLAIAGGTDAHMPAYEQQVRDTVDRLGLASRVRLLGEIPPQQRWEMYDAAQIFVLPSHSENFGIVVAEAMARGCPVVVTDQVQSCEHVLAANAGIVVPRSVPALAEALEMMLTNAARRTAFGQSGPLYARRHFTWQRIAAEVRQMYESTIHAGRQLRRTVAVASCP